MFGRTVLAALVALALVFTACSDVSAGRKNCRTCRPAKANKQYRLKTTHRTARSSCVGSSCSAPGVQSRTIEKTKTKVRTTDRAAYLQAWAEEECRQQAKYGRVGHFRGVPRGARFVGVGRGGQTCMTSGTPVAEAHLAGYSCRIW
jgi:hypothetical protein